MSPCQIKPVMWRFGPTRIALSRGAVVAASCETDAENVARTWDIKDPVQGKTGEAYICQSSKHDPPRLPLIPSFDDRTVISADRDQVHRFRVAAKPFLATQQPLAVAVFSHTP
jgi:hypothetical protein